MRPNVSTLSMKANMKLLFNIIHICVFTICFSLFLQAVSEVLRTFKWCGLYLENAKIVQKDDSEN